MAAGLEQGHVDADDNVVMLGIGSGINCVMLGVNWQRALVQSKGTRPESKGSVDVDGELPLAR
jgi:3-oxoacyl-[acyl-carrier-protein] synthase-3